MKVSVIIPTYNRKKLLYHCIKNLLDQTQPPDEIIVIDDASTDGTENLAILKEVKFIKLNNRIGPAGARNIGIKKANGDIIIFVDSDVLVDKNFIADHLYFHKKFDKIIVQGLVRHIKKEKDFGIKTFRIDGISWTGFIAQNCSIRKTWLISANLFNESYIVSEDVELGMRLKAIGLKTIYAFRTCIAYHIDGYNNKEKLTNVFKKYEYRGAISATKNIEKLVNIKSLFIYKIFRTKKWVDKYCIDLLQKLLDFPMIWLFFVIKGIAKHHYRAKGFLNERKNN